jgi:hypothetical protein
VSRAIARRVYVPPRRKLGHRLELVARSPDQERLAASGGRNGLPTTMIAVLVLIAATLVAAFLPLIRRRRDVPGHPGT